MRTRLSYTCTHVVSVRTDIVDVDISFLLGVHLLMDLKAFLDIGRGSLASTIAGWEIPFVRTPGHLYIEWPSTVLFTVLHHCRIHRSILNEHPDQIFKVLRRVDSDATNGTGSELSDKICREFGVCRRMADAPHDSSLYYQIDSASSISIFVWSS